VSAGYGILSAAIGRAEVLDSLAKGQHVFTFSANPPSCAVCSRVIDIIKQNDYLEHNEKFGAFFLKKLNEIVSPFVKGVRGKGLMIGVEIDNADGINAGLVGLRCLEKGVLFGFYGKNNEVLRIHPPYIINAEDINFACNVLEETLREIEENKIPHNTYARFFKECVGLGK
jgi:4-aminobutyrate aminotransferase-like enzyme